MELSCYYTLVLGLLVGCYEYRRVTGFWLEEVLWKYSVLSSMADGSPLPGQLGNLLRPFAPTYASLLLFSAYMLLLYALTFLVPGYYYQGPPLRDGRVVQFYCNGLPILVVTVAVYTGLCVYGVLPWTVAYDHFGGLLFWALTSSFLVSLYLFLRGRWRGLASGKGVWEDFVMGQELVPEVLGLKLNFFWLRPSMMAWLFLNLGFLAKHYEVNHGQVSHSMLLYQLFTNAYVVDYFVFEEFVTSTWDIIAEKFGFMLVWGDLVFIPFTFTIQAWFLVDDQTYYHPVQLMALVLLFATGYAIFRFANKQKHDFKKNPTALVWGKKPQVLGGRLLVSGWWGLASHINYLGDLILAVSYAAPCGLFRTGSFLPWFYPCYLLILLIHRDWRDDAKCSEKYGKLWVEYRKRVPYHILPYVY